MTFLEEESDAALMIALVGWTFYTAHYHNGEEAARWYDSGSNYIVMNPPRWLWTLLCLVADIFMIFAMYVYIQNRFEIGEANSLTDAAVFSYIVACGLRKHWHRVFFEARTVAWAFVIQLLVFGFLMVTLGIMGANSQWTAFGLLMVTFVWQLFVLLLNGYWIYAVKHHPELDGSSVEFRALQKSLKSNRFNTTQASIQQQQQQQQQDFGVNHTSINMIGAIAGGGKPSQSNGGGGGGGGPKTGNLNRMRRRCK